MPTPTFKRISIEQFEQLVDAFPFTRQITSVHMHHTWKPRHADFRGHETIVAMWRHHTQVNGWRDIAQHITIDPEGAVWLGRNWNSPPASAAGHNGNAEFGPFMFEMIGDFDTGQDPFDGAQKATTLRVIACVHKRFSLEPGSLRMHNMMSSKSCPGSSIDRATVLAEVAALGEHERSAARRSRAPGKLPFPDEALRARELAIQALTRAVPDVVEPGDAELTHREHDELTHRVTAVGGERGAAQARDSGLGTAQLAALRPHLINLSAGRLSAGGEVSTSPADVDAIFDQHLPQALQQAQGQPLPIVFYAHGGLVAESKGLQIAARHIGWWRRNGVYPIHFVWETGLFETIAQLLSRLRRRRGFDPFEFVTDPVLEALARVGGGPRIWGGMKASAAFAHDAPAGADAIGGGAHYTARRLADFCTAHAAHVRLHAVGHSAGSIFHCHFVPLARALGAPAFASVQFMAPAVRVDTFKNRLLAQIGAGAAAESLTVFTMLKEFERKDNCAQIYRKSLLYLIHHALEAEDRAPILGLEESLRSDADLVAFFGLGAAASTGGSVVWSPSQGDSGTSASCALAHGDFDDDAPTMNSIARRVLGRADADPIEEFPVTRDVSAATRSWFDEIDWPPPLAALLNAAPAPLPPPAVPVVAPLPPAPLGGSAAVPTVAAGAANGAGRRIALCIGINEYPDPAHRLSGCVNDAEAWARTLDRLGFETSLLRNHEATRAAIDSRLSALVDGSRAGDVIVVQFAGHGSWMPDLDGDEDDNRDEALCPVDFASGALYIDDDIAQVLARLPDGVNLTLFMDCCHSGTNTRFAVGPGAPPPAAGAKARFVRPTAELIEAHKRFRADDNGSRQRGSRSGGRAQMRNVKFSACQDHQFAMESNGSGEFTLRALRILEGGIGGLSNRQFVERVIAAFGANPAQNPILDCADEANGHPLLQPWVGVASGDGSARAAGHTGAAGATPDARVMQAISLLARTIDTLAGR